MVNKSPIQKGHTVNVGRKQSPEHIQRRVLAGLETKKRNGTLHIGTPHTQEYRDLMSKIHKGKVVTQEVRDKIGDSLRGKGFGFKKGHEPLGRSVKGHRYELSEESKRKIGIANTGRYFSEEARSNMSRSGKGRIFSDDHKIRISIANMGRKVVMTEETKKKIREGVLKVKKKYKNTYIEVLIQVELMSRNILFEKHVSLCKVKNVDFFLPLYNIAIECDGCYWHRCPIHHPQDDRGVRAKDEMKLAILEKNGIKVFRFWEHDIKQSAKLCIDKLNIQ